MTAFIWTAAERAAWRPPARLTVSEWAEAHRYIVAKDAAEKGKWRNDRAPYLREVMDALGPHDPVEEVVFMKPARVGGTEAARNALAYWADQAPDPTMIVYPTEAAASEQMSKEVIPLFTDTPRLRRHLSGRDGDVKRHELNLAAMTLYASWAGSPQALASRTIRYGIADEVDKYPPFAGREADPISLFRRRMQTFGRRKKFFITSTPTTRAGAIARLFERCQDRRYYHVPCPHCGAYQRLVWAGVKWASRDPGEDKRDHAERVEALGLAWYECRECKGRIEERHKYDILNRGAWLSETPGVIAKRRGYQMSAIYSMLGVTLADLAGQFLRACAAKDEGDIGPLMEFVTQALGEPFEEVTGGVTNELFALKRARGLKAQLVPPWAGVLLSTADTQVDGFYWSTFAWGRGERGRLIDRGRAHDFADLERKTLGARYKIEGFEASDRELLGPARLYIDAGGGGTGDPADGSRTDEVYRFALARAGRVIPIKGWGGDTIPGALIMPRRVNYKPPGEGRSPYDVNLLMLDTQTLKDILAAWLAHLPNDEQGIPERLELAAQLVDAELVSHLTGERKIAVRDGAVMRLRWEKIPGRRVDYLDTFVYAVAAAKAERVETIADEATLTRQRIERARPAARHDDDDGAWADGSGWWDGKRR